jgi:hypothetical protein
MLLAILQFIPDEQDPAGLVSRLVAALPSGSYLASMPSSMWCGVARKPQDKL